MTTSADEELSGEAALHPTFLTEDGQMIPQLILKGTQNMMSPVIAFVSTVSSMSPLLEKSVRTVTSPTR